MKKYLAIMFVLSMMVGNTLPAFGSELKEVQNPTNITVKATSFEDLNAPMLTDIGPQSRGQSKPKENWDLTRTSYNTNFSFKDRVFTNHYFSGITSMNVSLRDLEAPGNKSGYMSVTLKDSFGGDRDRTFSIKISDGVGTIRLTNLSPQGKYYLILEKGDGNLSTCSGYLNIDGSK